MKCSLISFVTLRKPSEGNVPEKWRTNSWFLVHHNAPSHQSVLIKDFLAKEIVTKLARPHTELAPADLYLFPRLKFNIDWTALWRCYWHHYECDGGAEKAFTKWLPWMLPTPLQSLEEFNSFTKGIFWKKCSLNVLFYASQKESGSGNILMLPRIVIDRVKKEYLEKGLSHCHVSPPRTSHRLSWDRNQDTAVRTQRLTL